MELIEPMDKERFAKMNEFGDTWEDAPVRTRVPNWGLCHLKNGKNRTIC
jgi:hypothetical protein